MSSDKGDTYGSQVTFNDDGGRPQVDKYDKARLLTELFGTNLTTCSKNSKLRPNDQVRILKPARTGVFTVREVRDGKCTLLDENGALLDNGTWFEESDVELED